MDLTQTHVILDDPEDGYAMNIWNGTVFQPTFGDNAAQILLHQRLNFNTAPNDVFVIGYPKCGSTWLQRICLELLKQTPPHKNETFFKKTSNSIPFYESNANLDKIQQRMKSCALRLWRSHLSFDQFLVKSIDPNTKFIYLARDPKDVCVSFYFFFQKAFTDTKWDKPFTRTIARHADFFMKGLLWYGNYWDHVLSWYKAKHSQPNNSKFGVLNSDNILFLYYEDLLSDHAGSVRRIADFMGLEAEEGIVEEVVRKTTMRNMKQSMTAKKSWWTHVFGGEKFFRSGKAGDWKTHLTQRIADEMDNITYIRFVETDIKYFKELPEHMTRGRLLLPKNVNGKTECQPSKL